MTTISYVDAHRVKGLFNAEARNQAKMFLRKRGKRGEVPLLEASDAPLPPDKRTDTESLQIHQALTALPDIEAFIVYKYYGLEETSREIAADIEKTYHVKMSHGKVISIANRAKGKLKGILAGKQ
jgi:DNA-directed RNA polymerase specialized sigma24 family protein